MNICVLTSSYPLDENDLAAPFVPPFVREVQTRGHRVIVFTPAKQGAPPGWSDDAQVFRFNWMASQKRVVELSFRSPLDLTRMASLFWNGESNLRRVLQEREIDTCLALWAVPSGYLAMWAKQRLGVPYAVWALGSDINVWANYPVIRSAIIQTLENADALFADGFDLCHKTTTLSGKECRFLSSARKLPLEQAALSEFAPDRIHFLFAGRWERVKGVDILLEAVRLFVQKLGSDVAVLHILGSGSQEAKMRKCICDNRLEQTARLIVNPPLLQLAGFFRAADCMVIPSRSESIPLVFAEALQAHLSLIVSDVGDMGNLAREYAVGQVIPPGDPLALADAMIYFVKNGQERGARSQELSDLLDLRTSAEHYLAAMRNVPGKGASRS